MTKYDTICYDSPILECSNSRILEYPQPNAQPEALMIQHSIHVAFTFPRLRFLFNSTTIEIDLSSGIIRTFLHCLSINPINA